MVTHLLLAVKCAKLVNRRKQMDYKNLKQGPDIEGLAQSLRLGKVEDIGKNLINLLESVTLSFYPEIKKIKSDLSKLGLYPLLCGSGASVFGLAENWEAAGKAKEVLAGRWPIVIQTYTI